MQVPRPGGLVLEQPRDVAAPDGAFPGFPAHDLQRARQAERLGLEQVVEVAADLGLAVILLAVGVAARRPGGLAVVLADLLGPGAQDDAAAAGLGQRPGGVGVQPGALGDGGLHVGPGEHAKLPVGDLTDQGVIEDQPGPEVSVRAEAREGLVEVLLPGLGLFPLDPRPAAFQPASHAVDGGRRADEADGDVAGRGRGVRVGRAVHGDAVARVDVPVPGPELQLRLAEDVRFHRQVPQPRQQAAVGRSRGGRVRRRQPRLLIDRGIGVDGQQAAEQDPLVAAPEQGVLAVEVVRPRAHQLVDGAVAFHPLDLRDVLGVVIGVAAPVDREVVGRVDLQEPLPGPPAEVQPGRVMPAEPDLGHVVLAVVRGEERAALAAPVATPYLPLGQVRRCLVVDDLLLRMKDQLVVMRGAQREVQQRREPPLHVLVLRV